MQPGGDHRGGGVGAHAAGVGAAVALVSRLVILRGGQGQDVFAVHHDDEAGLLALQEFLDHHPVPGLAEGIAGQHVLRRGDGLVFRLRQDHALAGGQTVGLDHDGRALLADVGDGLADVGEVAVGGGGNMVAGEKVLGEGLGAFQLRRALCRAEAAQAGVTEGVHHAQHQWRLGADDGLGDVVVAGEGHQGVDVLHADGDVFHLGLVRRAGVAGGDEDLFHTRRLRRLPGQGVLAPAAADYQYLHGCAFLSVSKPRMISDLDRAWRGRLGCGRYGIRSILRVGLKLWCRGDDK